MRLIEWSAEWLIAVVDSMVDFDVGSRVEVSRWKSLRQRRRIGLSIDGKIVSMVNSEVD